MARAAVLSFVPRLFATPGRHTWISHAGRLWEVQQWMPGRADYRSRPSHARLNAVGTALAQLHKIWRATEEVGEDVCPGVARRLFLIDTWRKLRRAGWRPTPAWDDPLRPVIERAAEVLPRRVEWAASLLRGVQIPRLLQPCLRDPWHDHILFTGEQLTGLIDYGAAQLDHPAVDLARALGSLAGDDVAGWQVGLAAYRNVLPLSAADEQLAMLLDQTGVVLAAANWLIRLFHEGPVAADRPAIAARLEQLVARIELGLRNKSLPSEPEA